MKKTLNEKLTDKKRKLEKEKDIKWAVKKMEELREKSSGFTGGITAANVIREFREKCK